MMIKGKILSTSTKDITHVRILIKFNKNENIKQEHGDINNFGETIIIIIIILATKLVIALGYNLIQYLFIGGEFYKFCS